MTREFLTRHHDTTYVGRWLQATKSSPERVQCGRCLRGIIAWVVGLRGLHVVSLCPVCHGRVVVRDGIGTLKAGMHDR